MVKFVREVPSGDGWQMGPYRFFPSPNGGLIMEVGGVSYNILLYGETGKITWKGEFTCTLDGTANTANRSYTLPNASGELVLTANPTFTGLLTTPALRLNNAAVLVNNSAPTVRSDGSALEAGDFWLNPSTGIIGFWRSPYWLSTDQYFVADILRNQSTSNGSHNPLLIPHLNFSSVFLEECSLGLTSQMTGCDSNNYWEVIARYDTNSVVEIPGGKITVNTNLSDNTIVFATLNVAILLSGNTRFLYMPQYNKVGTPGNLASIWAVKLRLILN